MSAEQKIYLYVRLHERYVACVYIYIHICAYIDLGIAIYKLVVPDPAGTFVCIFCSAGYS